jgi:catechol 2,3-dioxygenase-like lactoylglutathione lyase family enzyme
MLQERHIHAVVPAADLDRARTYWEGTVGLKPTTIRSNFVIYQCLDSWFALSKSGGAGTAQSTAAAFMSHDLAADVAELKGRGVVFEEYDYPTLKTVDSIADTGTFHAAWFRDSEGNIIGLVQFAEPPL